VIFTVVMAALLGTGVAVALRALSPSAPRLAEALAGNRVRSGIDLYALTDDQRQLRAVRLGDWLQQRVGHTRAAVLNHADLALLDMTAGQIMVRRLFAVLVGLVYPPVLTAAVITAGINPPIGIPLIGGIAAAAVLWFVPALQVRAVAGAMRREFNDDIIVYNELLLIQRASTAGINEAIEQGAYAGNTWTFLRIRDALEKARLATRQPHDALRALARQVDSEPLLELANILRNSELRGTAILTALRVRVEAARETGLARLQIEASKATSRMAIPYSLLGMIFVVLFGYPALHQLTSL